MAADSGAEKKKKKKKKKVGEKSGLPRATLELRFRHCEAGVRFHGMQVDDVLGREWGDRKQIVSGRSLRFPQCRTRKQCKVDPGWSRLCLERLRRVVGKEGTKIRDRTGGRYLTRNLDSCQHGIPRNSPQRTGYIHTTPYHNVMGFPKPP